ncbi:hypothetical protein [uncultured Sphingomonas sp.]|uniref:hypothetical protein n=1 Tax=uncultured Sphingomonas sp. TaxID=158754 RepID=UPI0025FDC056|nr:hypothetical protein [uncultured Sphingomonas sp.]
MPADLTRIFGGRGRFLLLVLLMLGLMTPALIAAPMSHDSFWIDRVWLEQFTAGLRAGNPYPRWLPLSFGGLGAPVFYFYAPLSFHLAGLFGLAGLPTYAALMAAFGAAWLGSGFAMYAWLKRDAPAPLVGAGLYMVMPYHVMDFYGRGALAEFCAFALIPLVALGLRRSTEGGGSARLALPYAALAMTHLPTAVIVSALLIVPAAVWYARADWRKLVPAIQGVTCGIGLAAIYLLPALTLQHHSSVAALWSVRFLQPGSWSILHPQAWPSTSYVLMFAGLALCTALAALVLSRRSLPFWPLWTIVVCAIVAGLIPGVWSLPVLKAVQFPWRALALAEFGVVTVAACYRGSPVIATAMLSPLLGFTFLMINPANPMGGDPMQPLPVPGRQDVIEYLPIGAVGPERTARVDAIRQAVVSAGRHPASTFPFPSLKARCADGRVTNLARNPESPLVFSPPLGCAVSVEHVPAERLGAAISLLFACLLAGFTLPRQRRRRWPFTPQCAASGCCLAPQLVQLFLDLCQLVLER